VPREAEGSLRDDVDVDGMSVRSKSHSASRGLYLSKRG